jgi:hypothetical protein
MSSHRSKLWRSLLLVIKYLFLGLGIFIILIILLLASAYNNLRTAALDGLSGRRTLSAAVVAAKAQNWPETSTQTTAAHNYFVAATDNLDQARINSAIKYFPPLSSQLDNLEYLIKTAEILTRSLQHLLPIVQELDAIRSGTASRNFADLPDSDKQKFLQLIYESEPELNGLRANLDLAALNLDRIQQISILWPIYSQIANIKQELQDTSALMTKLSPVIKLLPALTGYPETSRFLIVLQNNDELRPSGGFIGTYGLLELKNGQITSLKTDDSYHIDMLASLSDKWTTPTPDTLKKYLKVEKWYLRDANWSPDWPTSAQKIQEIYNGERVATKQDALPFTGVIAINPGLIADLLKLVGPVELHGATYQADNLQQLLQYNVEVAYKEQKISSWDRKDIINELMAEIKNRLFHLSSDHWSELFKTLDRNVNNKNIQVYFNAPAWETLAQNVGLTGEIKNPASDYLLVVDANLGAFKSDAVMNKSISYTVKEDGRSLSSWVRLNYRHEGGFDWRTTRYRSYTRIYVPWGSQLTSIEGLDANQADVSATNDQQLHKTIFGFFMSIEPGTAQTISIKYNLPAELQSQLITQGYRLLAQKQSGQRLAAFTVNLQVPSRLTQEWSDNSGADGLFTAKN